MEAKSFKLCLQICNVKKPNAKQNTFVVACMPIKDLHATLATIYKDQIQTLQKECWRKKKIRLFGDYAFCHPCLACLEQEEHSSVCGA